MRVAAVGVVVPAHDEQDQLGACLRAVRRAAGHPALRDVAVRAFVVLDRCSDRSAEVALEALTGFPATLIEVAHGNVGMSRAGGVAAAMAEFGTVEPQRLWLATTDADTRVPAGWLARHLQLATRGWEAVAGTVRVADWSDQPQVVRERFLRLHEPGASPPDEHLRVYGANLGFSALAYRRAGGFPPLALAEDHALWERLRTSGSRTLVTRWLPVATSARREPRAVGGFGDYLRALGVAAGVGAVRVDVGMAGRGTKPPAQLPVHPDEVHVA